MYKLLALDLDGTLLNSQNQVSDENKSFLQAARDKGVNVLLVSGRPYRSMISVAEALALKECLIVAMAGSDIRQYPSGKSISLKCMTNKQIADLHQLAMHYDTYFQAFRADGSYYYHSETTYSRQYEAYFGYSGQKENLMDLPYEDVCKGMFIMEAKAMEEMEQIIEKQFWGQLRVEKIWETIIDVYARDVDKGTGIKYAATVIGVNKDEIIAVGDEKVDLPMFREAGLSIAMGNAEDTVKQMADAVTWTNDNHGIAQVIRQYILNQDK